MASNEIDDPWCKALHDCTNCLREQNAEDADIALAFLSDLERRLEKEDIAAGVSGNDKEDDDDYEEDKVPGFLPFSWGTFHCIATEIEDLKTAIEVGLATKTKQIRTNHISINSDQRLSCQRLLTRIFTSQSELFAMKATHIVKNQGDWNLAGQAYEASILKIHKALEVTDTAISKWWNRWEKGLELIVSEQELLARDASIVVVALESLIFRRDRLLSMGKREESRLLRKLQPQWESRDVIKERMGTNRWRNNPNPKHDHAKLRADLEAELKSLQKAMFSLEELDPNQALQKASGLKEQMLSGNNRRSNSSSVSKDASTSMAKQETRRYNQQRPSPGFMVLRVPLEVYPDPCDFGWTFTGSWEAVEFFERTVTAEDNPSENNNNNNNDSGNGKTKDTKPKLVKLDWYFTTGTIKTSLDHPVQGKTQLFAKQCTPRLYAKVLTNPRTHTGKRYQRKQRQVTKHCPPQQQLSH